EARLSFSIIGDGIHEHADPPHPRRLLRPCRERPCRCAAKRDNELPPSDMDCHMTLPWGSCNGGDDITPGPAALRDFVAAGDRLGSFSSFPPSPCVRFAPRADIRPMPAFMSTHPNASKMREADCASHLPR